MKNLLIGGALLALTSGSAVAQSTPNWNWAGGYAALTFGGTTANIKDFAEQGRKGTGGTVGVAFGFSSQARNRPDLVYGGDFEFNLSQAGESRSCPDGDFVCEAKAKSFGSVRAHVGKVQGNSIIFANAGLAFGSVDADVRYVGTGTGVSGNGSVSLQGGVVGVGIETRLNRRMNMRFDLSQYFFSSKDVNIAGTTQDKVGLDALHIRFGIVSRF